MLSLFNSSTVFYPPYLLSAFFISILWLKKNSNMTWKNSLHYFFNKRIWISKESLIDLFFCFFIILGMRQLTGPLEDWIFSNQLDYLNRLLSYSWHFSLPPLFEGIIATIITMLAIDGSSYFIHRSMHSNKFLWKTHRLHHSLTSLNFMSAHRQNPLEFIILNVGRTFSAALGLAFFHWFFPQETPVITIQGLGAGFFIYMFTVNLHHSHIPVQYPKIIRSMLISPHVHHLHHSANPKHFGMNYGVVFSFWDRLFGTYMEENVNVGELRFGNDSHTAA